MPRIAGQQGRAASRGLAAAAAAAVAAFVGVTVAIAPPAGAGEPRPCLQAPPLPTPDGPTIEVETEPELRAAVANAPVGATILIAPGTYALTQQLGVGSSKANLTIRGATDRCDDVTLVGGGMDNPQGPQHGISSFGAPGLTIANLTIRDVWNHAIQLQPGSDDATIHNVRLLNAGQQFLKANPVGGAGDGVADGIVRWSIFQYTDGTPSHPGSEGYTNGMSLHGVSGWRVHDNLFVDIHNPDDVNPSYWYVPAVLVWNGSSDTIVENNLFVNCDRAVALGLCSSAACPGHSGGAVRNNFIAMAPELFTGPRRSSADAPILVWNSPGTQVDHNSVLVRDNHFRAVDVRVDGSGVRVRNNLIDAPVVGIGASVDESGNILFDSQLASALFLSVDPDSPDLHLRPEAVTAIDRVPALGEVTSDADGEPRPVGGLADAGADEFRPPQVGVAPAPDGTAPGVEPLRARKLDGSGGTLEVTWDAAACTANAYTLLWGGLDGVAGARVDGAVCNAGFGDLIWSGAPAGDVWFLAVGTDGGAVESGWGEDGEGRPRGGTDASDTCGATIKDLGAECVQAPI